MISIYFIISIINLLSFVNEEKDFINRALKYLDENKYNETVGELEEELVLVKSKAELQLVNLFFCKEDPQMFGIYNIRENS